jgi:DNA-binding winged helix-turn-helix (wHTH) protein
VAKIFYQFNEFRLDVQQRLLTTDSGRPIPLPPKAFETLLYFVERRGELLEKTVIMKAVWPNIVVEENSLNQNISIIRRALGEAPGEHRFIVTEPGRGYRFVADENAVAEQQPAIVRAPSVLEATAAQRRSIAVLAFANLTGDPAKEYFSDGMAEELIHTLARIPGLKVPSRTSSFAYKGRAFLWMREMLPFRNDPRYQTLCRRMRLFDYWQAHGPPDNCELRDSVLICH